MLSNRKNRIVSKKDTIKKQIDDETLINMNNSQDFSVNQSLIQQVWGNGDNDQIMVSDQVLLDQQLEWIKKKAEQKKQMKLTKNLSKSQDGQIIEEEEQQQQQEKAGCAVYIRLRPDQGEELEHRQCVEQIDKNTLSISGDNNKQNIFKFDKIFNEDIDQQQMFNQVALPLVKDFINGYNESILVYGQSGSGKTHTILGPGFDNQQNIQLMKQQIIKQNNKGQMIDENYGLVPRIVQSIFDIIYNENHSDKTYDIRMSYIEIYNEKIRDLLNVDEEYKAKIYHDKDSNLVVCNATQIPIDSSAKMLDLIQIGSMKRKMGETDLNMHSSRSHGIIVLTCITSKNEEQTASQMLLIDLAGTENVEKSGAEGIRMKEACNINQSLLALGNVIDDIINLNKLEKQLKLAKDKKTKKILQDQIKNQHIGYRDSLLTRLLENCLGGNSYTRLICCSSKNSLNRVESLSTFRFASRASQIQNTPQVNKKMSATQLQKLLDLSQQSNKNLTLINSFQNDIINNYQQIINQIYYSLPPRFQQTYSSLISNSLQQIHLKHSQLKINQSIHTPLLLNNKKKFKQDLLKYIGKYSAHIIFSFLDFRQIFQIQNLNILTYNWLTRSDNFWKQVIIKMIKEKLIFVDNLDTIPDYRIYINQHFNSIYQQKQASKIKSHQAGLSLFKGTAR